METKKELDLRELLSALSRKVWLIVICAVLLGAVLYVYTAVFVTPLYKSSISIYISNTNVSDLNGMTSSDLLTSQNLVGSYVKLLSSDKVLEAVAEELDEEYTANQIRSMMKATVEEGTVLFTVSVSDEDPQVAADVANAIANVAPGAISSIVKGTSAETVDYAKVAATPYTPNRIKNTIIGVAVGVLLAVAFVVLQTLLDTHINGEEDLRKLSDAPVLGVIPDYDLEYKKGNGYESDKATRDETMHKGA